MQVTRNGTHVMADYPKWIERDGKPFLVQSEDHEMELDDEGEKDRIVNELKLLGHTVDLRRYKGPSGMVALVAFHEAAIRGEVDGNGSNDS